MTRWPWRCSRRLVLWWGALRVLRLEVSGQWGLGFRISGALGRVLEGSVFVGFRSARPTFRHVVCLAL